MSKQTSKGEERQQAIVEAAYHLIAENGLEGLRTRDVASRVEINIATLHYYFDTKEALIQAVVSYALDQFMTVTAPPLPSTGTAMETQLRQMFADFQFQVDTAPEMFVVLNELHLRAFRDTAVQGMLAGLNNHWQEYLVSVFAQGRSELRIEPEQAASLVIALIKGMSLQTAVGLANYDIDQVSTDVVAWIIKS